MCVSPLVPEAAPRLHGRRARSRATSATPALPPPFVASARRCRSCTVAALHHRLQLEQRPVSPVLFPISLEHSRAATRHACTCLHVRLPALSACFLLGEMSTPATNLSRTSHGMGASASTGWRVVGLSSDTFSLRGLLKATPCRAPRSRPPPARCSWPRSICKAGSTGSDTECTIPTLCLMRSLSPPVRPRLGPPPRLRPRRKPRQPLAPPSAPPLRQLPAVTASARQRRPARTRP